MTYGYVDVYVADVDVLTNDVLTVQNPKVPLFMQV